MPIGLKSTADTYSGVRPGAHDTPLVDKSNRTVEQWVTRAADKCRAETGDDSWKHLGPHDLRRT